MTQEDLAIEYTARSLPFATVITLGSEGAMIVSQGKVRRVPCPKVQAVDTSGAGDCFNAAVAYCIAQGKSLLSAVEFAVKAASFSVMREQVWPSYPTVGQIIQPG